MSAKKLEWVTYGECFESLLGPWVLEVTRVVGGARWSVLRVFNLTSGARGVATSLARGLEPGVEAAKAAAVAWLRRHLVPEQEEIAQMLEALGGDEEHAP